jgi:site-specific DNA-cytosine methylase
VEHVGYAGVVENVAAILNGGSDVQAKQCECGTQSGQYLGVDEAVVCPNCGRSLRDATVVNVRAEWMGAVLWSLSRHGFDAEWTTLRASDIGACHRRERWFCLARHADNERRQRGGLTVTEDSTSGLWSLDLLPTPTASDAKDGTVMVEARNSQRSNAGQSITRSLANL